MPTRKTESQSIQRKVPAVSRAVAILEYLSHANEPIGVVPLARQIGVIPSTCLHILRTLGDEGLVMVNPRTKQYSIGAGVLSLARAYARHDPLIQMTQERLAELSNKHNCAFAAIRRNGEQDYIVVAIGDTQSALSVRVAVGARFPLLVSAVGMCFAAFGALPADGLKERFAQLEWAKPLSWDGWADAVEATRVNGFGRDEGHFILGTIILSVPFFDPDHQMIGCISAIGLRERVTRETEIEIISDLRNLADETKAALAVNRTKAIAAKTLRVKTAKT